VVPRSRQRAELGRLLRTGARPGPAEVPPDLGAAVTTDPERLPVPDAWRSVARARSLERPTTLDYLGMAFDDFQELRGDRLSGDCRAVVGGVARLAGRSVVVVGTQKGHTADELVQRNFGMATPAGYHKAARLMRLADKLGLPVVTLIDTPGAYPGAEAEERGQSVAIAENLRLMASLAVPVVAVITGEGGSGGALALGVANRVLMFSDSIYSVISPEGCAAIVWNDPAAAPEAAQALRLNARDLLRLGVVDGVIPEPADGVDAAPLAAAERLRDAVQRALAELAPLSGPELTADRRARFRRFGATPGDGARPAPAELMAVGDGLGPRRRTLRLARGSG
jgi:acetyl-CoA carboxylase carboxyl transferase subunit beta